jgi:beta-phosphoglucomutase family hydrolase
MFTQALMSHREPGKNLYSQMGKASLIKKVAHGIREFPEVFLFLAPWFLAFSTYRMLLLRRLEPFEYGTGLLNALVLSKIILTGDYLQLAKNQENKPLIYPTIWKAFLFTLLATGFYIVEHIVRGLLRGGGIAAGLGSLREMGTALLLGRSLVMFFAFLPFFALRETGRALGKGRLHEMFFGVKPSAEPHELETGSTNANPTDLRDYQAVLFDMDGVITDTASIHAACWKTMFDEYLRGWAKERNVEFRPFDVATDYKAYVDGKPRYDGVRDFLKSRGIALPEGMRDDPPTAETVCGLGNRKDKLVDVRLAKGVEAYPGSVALLRHLRCAGVRTAVVTSSQNCRTVLQATGVENLFDARVDGLTMASEGLAGKPAPDSFLRAAEMLEVRPESAVVIEDAISGVQAGKRGRFGLVIGVDRKGNAEELKENGAQMIVRDLAELLPSDITQPLRPAA